MNDFRKTYWWAWLGILILIGNIAAFVYNAMEWNYLGAVLHAAVALILVPPVWRRYRQLFQQ